MLLDHTPPTVRAIYAHYEHKAWNGHSPRLGASEIAKECPRDVWLKFRWCSEPEKHPGERLRLFQTGHRIEAQIIEELRTIGIQVWDRDPENPTKQITFTAIGGHFVCKPDGVAIGFEESSKPHALEVKSAKDDIWKKIDKNGPEKEKPDHWAQIHLEMYLGELERCYYIVHNKDTDRLLGQRITLDKAFAMQLLAKAERIIFSDKPPMRISDDPSHFVCKRCSHSKVCHQAAPPEVNCRSCAHITPEKDGTWTCAKHKKMLSTDDQRAACPDHLINPYVVDRWEVTDATDDWIEFTTPHGEVIKNAGNSKEIREGWCDG